MDKATMLTDPNSCLSRAIDGEACFLLLARDASAPAAIRAWVLDRMRHGQAVGVDSQLVNALVIADFMDEQRPELREALGLKLSEADVQALGRKRAGKS